MNGNGKMEGWRGNELESLIQWLAEKLPFLPAGCRQHFKAPVDFADCGTEGTLTKAERLFMKPILAVFLLFAALGVRAQTTTWNDTMESQIRRGLLEGHDRNLLTIQPERANEIRNGRVSYDGIFVQLIKTDNRWQLINPFAPPQYGSSRDNVLVNPTARPEVDRPQGLNLFSIRF